MYLSVVFSFYNEEAVIPELLRRVRTALRSRTGDDYELIFVDDASTDGSLPLLLAEAATHHDVRVVTMSRNFGVAECTMAGFSYARGDLVVYLDADLQDPPELIPELLDLWQREQADVIHTVRLSRAGENPLKLLLTRIGYMVLRRAANINLLDNAGDFKLLSRRAVRHLLQLQEHRPYVRGLATWIGFKQAILPYRRESRFGGKTKFPVYSRKVIDNFLGSALISFSDVPLKIALVLGFIISFGAFAYLVAVIVMKFFDMNLPGWSAIMVTMLMLGGIQLFTLGVLGLYINAIYLETKKRPNYIVAATYGFPAEGGTDAP